MAKQPQKVISTRVPEITYKLLMERSYKEGMSSSALMRLILIGFLKADDSEIDKIRCYGAQKAREIADAIENGWG